MKRFSLHRRKDINMGSHQIRELLHKYINKADERLINLMHAMVQADMDEMIMSSVQQIKRYWTKE